MCESSKQIASEDVIVHCSIFDEEYVGREIERRKENTTYTVRAQETITLQIPPELTLNPNYEDMFTLGVQGMGKVELLVPQTPS